MPNRPPDSDCAINTNLVRYAFKGPHSIKDPISVRLHFRVKTKIRDLSTDKAIAAGRIRQARFEPSEAELAIDDGDSNNGNWGLWVGMRPLHAEQYTRKAMKDHCKARSIEESIGKVSVRIIPYDENALRVVVPLTKGGQSLYFVLANPDKDNVCDAVQCSVPDVFFFSQYRDASIGRIDQREGVSSRMIQGVLKAWSRSQETQSRSYEEDDDEDLLKYSMPPLDPLLESSEHCWSPRTQIHNLECDRASIEPAQVFRGLVEDSHIHRGYIQMFVEDCHNLDEQSCEQFRSELEKTFLGIDKLRVTVSELQQMCQACADGEISMENRFVRAFVVAFIMALRRKALNTTVQASGILYMVRLQLGVTPAHNVPLTVGMECDA